MSSGVIVVILVLVLVNFGFISGNEADLRKIDSIKSELPCLAAGGICTIAIDCPDGQLSEQRGLCPKQRRQGVECCHGISTRETRCAKHGGVCMSLAENRCNPPLIFHGATDCIKFDKQCCIMV